MCRGLCLPEELEIQYRSEILSAGKILTFIGHAKPAKDAFHRVRLFTNVYRCAIRERATELGEVFEPKGSSLHVAVSLDFYRRYGIVEIIGPQL